MPADLKVLLEASTKLARASSGLENRIRTEGSDVDQGILLAELRSKILALIDGEDFSARAELVETGNRVIDLALFATQRYGINEVGDDLKSAIAEWVDALTKEELVQLFNLVAGLL